MKEKKMAKDERAVVVTTINIIKYIDNSCLLLGVIFMCSIQCTVSCVLKVHYTKKAAMIWSNVTLHIPSTPPKSKSVQTQNFQQHKNILSNQK